MLVGSHIIGSATPVCMLCPIARNKGVRFGVARGYPVVIYVALRNQPVYALMCRAQRAFARTPYGIIHGTHPTFGRAGIHAGKADIVVITHHHCGGGR